MCLTESHGKLLQYSHPNPKNNAHCVIFNSLNMCMYCILTQAYQLCQCPHLLCTFAGDNTVNLSVMFISHLSLSVDPLKIMSSEVMTTVSLTGGPRATLVFNVSSV